MDLVMGKHTHNIYTREMDHIYMEIVRVGV